MPDPHYMSKQKELQWKVRSVLINWLVEVHDKFKLLPETLYLTVNIIDRFLSHNAVILTKLQLVGITALFIAAKYEEVYVPSISQFVYISDGSCNHEDLVSAERFILGALKFNLQMPNPLNFLRRCSKADDYTIGHRTMAKYLMETMLLHEAFLVCPPSMTAAIGLCLARIMMSGETNWDANLTHYSGYTFDELKPCMLKLLQFLSHELKYTAIAKKYNSKQYNKVSQFAFDWIHVHKEADLPMEEWITNPLQSEY
jgi:G2/mitotic-specific cyclin 1/2